MDMYHGYKNKRTINILTKLHSGRLAVRARES